MPTKVITNFFEIAAIYKDKFCAIKCFPTTSQKSTSCALQRVKSPTDIFKMQGNTQLLPHFSSASPWGFALHALRFRVNQSITNHLPMTEHLFISSSYVLHFN
jgi:hypothetical protein